MQAVWQLVGWHFSELSVMFSGFFVAWMVSRIGDLCDMLRKAITGRDIAVDVGE